MGLSDKTKSICKEHYRKACPFCPIRRECIHPIGPGHEGLERWQDKVNAAAEELET